MVKAIGKSIQEEHSCSEKRGELRRAFANQMPIGRNLTFEVWWLPIG